MPGNHATGTLGILSSSELDRDTAGLQGTYGWMVQSGAVTFSATLTFNVAAIAAGDYMVNSVVGAVYAGGTVTLGAQDATNPRVDVVVVTSAGAVSVVAGTPKALTTTSGPVPTAPSATQLEIARIYVPASGTALTSANITDRRVALGASGLFTTGVTKNYKSATQVFTTNTTFADITGAKGATFAFAIGVNEVWRVRYVVQVSFGGTGGVKLQLTGPAAPTAVAIIATAPIQLRDSTTASMISPASGTAQSAAFVPLAVTTAFSTPFANYSSSNSATTDQYGLDLNRTWIFVDAIIANGANAGSVVLQGAQNSSNSTTTFGLGCSLKAERIS